MVKLRQVFEDVAKILREAREDPSLDERTISTLENTFLTLFSTYNPRFSIGKFVRASHPTDDEAH